MPRKFLIERYVVAAVLPYFTLSLLVLTGVLLIQQSLRFTEILSEARAPFSLALELTRDVIPGILIFTLPMATLMGTSVGFARLGGDSELVALRAAGIGAWRLAAPMLAFGFAVTALTVSDAFVVAPGAARSLRDATLHAALERLESPIQPGSFNTQLPGKVIYVRDGDEAAGQWGRVFIRWAEPGEDLRLVTARKGRIDLSGGQSELVLSDAVVTTLPTAGQPSGATSGGKFITERSEQLRVRLNTGRETLLGQFNRPPDVEEMNWGELLASYHQGDYKQRRDVQSSLNKRLALAVSPLAFVLIGVSLGGRARRGGRALGAGLSLSAMIVFYVLFLAGDYLTRTGSVPPALGAWGATAAALLGGLWGVFFNPSHGTTFSPTRSRVRKLAFSGGGMQDAVKLRRFSLLGRLDKAIIKSLLAHFTLALVSLVAIFLVFTFFEMLRSSAGGSPRLNLIGLYLFYLTPLAIEGVLPVAVLISILTTYALMSRWGESVSWFSGGQSMYRLALPSLFFSIIICNAYWLIQERVLPLANIKQENLRMRIRKGPSRVDTETGLSWLAIQDRRIYSYQYETLTGTLKSPVLYLFDEQGTHLELVINAERGYQNANGTVALAGAVAVAAIGKPSRSGGDTQLNPGSYAEIEDPTPYYLFKPQLSKPEHYNTQSISAYIKRLSVNKPVPPDLAVFVVALWKRRFDPLSPIVMWFIGVPLGLAFGRRTVVMPLMLAVVVGICHWIGSAILSQAGAYGLIPAYLSATSFPALLLLLGVYFFSRVRT